MKRTRKEAYELKEEEDELVENMIKIGKR